MTSKTDEQSLSNLELLVLARLACAKGANEDELAAALTEVAPPDGPQTARAHVVDALTALRGRSLVASPKPTKRSQKPRSQPTAEGNRLVCSMLGLNAKPRWDKVKARCAALALGISASSEQASKLSQADELTLTVLRQHFKISEATTVVALCDALIADKLGFSGKVTMLQLRAHILAKGLGLDYNVESTDDLETLAVRIASKSQDPASEGKQPLLQALGRRWAYRMIAAPNPPSNVGAVATSPAVAASPQMNLPGAVNAKPVNITPGSMNFITPAPVKPNDSGGRGRRDFMAPAPVRPNDNAPHGLPPEAVSADMLLNLVREAIPKIGSDGRFGPEKVFVSALWHYIEDDGRLPELSLDRFKRWLVTANRDQLIDLVRADSQGDMDGRLLEESEIRDLGATFHFVVDRQTATSRGYHAR